MCTKLRLEQQRKHKVWQSNRFNILLFMMMMKMMRIFLLINNSPCFNPSNDVCTSTFDNTSDFCFCIKRWLKIWRISYHPPDHSEAKIVDTMLLVITDFVTFLRSTIFISFFLVSDTLILLATLLLCLTLSSPGLETQLSRITDNAAVTRTTPPHISTWGEVSKI